MNDNRFKYLFAQKEAIFVMDALENAGFEARFVGGCVRDCLAGVAVGDIDLATTATPECVQEIFAKEKIKTVPTGIEHGTVTIVFENQSFEVTTLRSDINHTGRHAEVVFTTDWQEDAARRDFTINALSVDRQGILYDYFEGERDLKTGAVRFIGAPEERIHEDYLRILRFFRFSARFAKKYDKAGLAACVALKDGMAQLSIERSREELFKMIDQGGDRTVFDLLYKNKIIEFSNLDKLINLEYELKKEVFFYFAFVQNSMAPIDVKAKWKLSNTFARSLKVFEKADALLNEGYNKYQAAYYTDQKIVHDLLVAGGEQVDDLLAWQKPVCPITAQTLLDQGYVPGPELGRKLKDLEKEWVFKQLT